jgi:hypothetical protein
VDIPARKITQPEAIDFYSNFLLRILPINIGVFCTFCLLPLSQSKALIFQFPLHVEAFSHQVEISYFHVLCHYAEIPYMSLSYRLLDVDLHLCEKMSEITY